MFEEHFASPAAYRAAIDRARDAVLAWTGGPYSGAAPADLAFDGPVLPEDGVPLAEVVDRAAREVLAHSIRLTDPLCAAHLHAPPAIAGLAADVLISASNQSLDAFDAAPAATMLETHLVRWLCDLAGFPHGDGVFTSGATQSTLTGLLLARDHHCTTVLGHDVRRHGVPPGLKIVTTPHAHFSVVQSAHVLGLGEDAVVAADDVPAAVAREGAFAAVLTAGSTDRGIIDPLRATGTWLHVDAAYAGGLLLSRRHRDRLAGLERADSVSVDFHKLVWCPIGCGALLLRDGSRFDLMRRHADYLNPEGRAEPDLVGKSLATTRPFDALKLWMTCQALGERTLGDVYDHLLALAAAAADAVRARPQLELYEDPQLTTVLFRHRTADNDEIRRSLLFSGRAVIARTRLDGEVWLKLTLLNPLAGATHLEDLLDVVARA